MSLSQVCAVIPAAGRGSRLGMSMPKLLVPIDDRRTIWTILRDKLLPHVTHIHVVLSPTGYPLFQEALVQDPNRHLVSSSIQAEPLGMGDAIFRGQEVWADSESIFVVWGDQIHLSEQTIRGCFDRHAMGCGSRCTLPLVEVENPYVQYLFDQAGTLCKIRQTREGDTCDPRGDSDVGAFLLSVEGLLEAWQGYLAGDIRGTQTSEINFLPFLEVLAQQWHWPFQTVRITDATECRGINTPEDLAFFRRLYRRNSDF
jgi:bifunctional UDP-N-acetylglucosamine pyrophosphorylase / glucosamine-1-phosphate N-acetyltransferase